MILANTKPNECMGIGTVKILAFTIAAILCTPIFSLITSPVVSAKEPKIDWLRQFGTDNNDAALGIDSSVNRAYVVGVTSGTFPGQTYFGGNDAFIARFKKSGKIQWLRQFGSSSDDRASGVAADSSGAYIAGDTYGTLPGQTSGGSDDAFVVKYDKKGNLLWTYQFGTSALDWASGIDTDISGIYATGGTTGTFPSQTSAGGQDVYLARFDSSGNKIWLRQFGTSTLDEAFDVFSDNTGIYVTGDTSGAFSGQTNVGGQDAFLAKFDSSGNLIWVRQIGSIFDDQALAVSGDSSGLYIGGLTFGAFPGQVSAGSTDAFVAKFDRFGNLLWVSQLGTETYDDISGITTVRTAVYVGGVTWGTLPGQIAAENDDSFVAKFDSSGNLLGLKQFGTGGGDYLSDITSDRSKVYVTGQTSGEFEGEESAGGEDGFLGRFKAKPDGASWDNGDMSGPDNYGLAGSQNSGIVPNGSGDNNKGAKHVRPPARGHKFETGGS